MRDTAASTRSAPRWLIAAAAVLMIARVALELTASAEAPRDLVSWKSFAVAKDDARASGKPLLVVASASWCAPCRGMEREVFADAHAAERIAELYEPVHVVVDGREPDPNAITVLDAEGVNSYPTLLVVFPRNRTARQSGYSGRDDTLRFLEATAAGRP
jgi:thiol:disulfide interchange protein